MQKRTWLQEQEILTDHHTGTRDKNRGRLIRNLLLIQKNWLNIHKKVG